MFGRNSSGQNNSPFGTSPTPAYGAFTQTHPFGSSDTSVFGQKPDFGAFGSSPAQTSPFGGTAQQPFGSNIFGATSTPFGGSFPVFGCGSTNTSAFGTTTYPGFGSQAIPAFGAVSPFGAQSSSFGPQSAAPTLGNTAFGQSTFGAQAAQRVGSRVTPYQVTPEPDSNGVGKLMSISAMAAYKEQNQEELRWEDYQSGDTGGSFRSVGGGFDHSTVQTNCLNPNPATSFPQSFSSPFNTSTSSSLFAPKTSSFPSFDPFDSSTSSSFFAPKTSSFSFSEPFNTPTSSSLFSPNTPSFPSTGSGVTSPSLFNSPFGSSLTQTKIFAPVSPAPFGQTSSPSPFSSTPSSSFSTPATTSTPSFNFPIQSNPQTQFGQIGTTSGQLGNTQPVLNNGGPIQPSFGTTSNSTLGTITINPCSGTSITITPTSATTITITPTLGSTTVTIAPISGNTSTSTSGHTPFPYPVSTSIFNTTNSFDQTQPGDRSSFSPLLFGRSQNSSEAWFGSVCPTTNMFNMLPERHPQPSSGHTAAPSPSFRDGMFGSLTATRDLRESVQNQTDVALRITKELLSTEGKDRNMVYSPLSIHVVLSLIAAGSTKGCHQGEMLKFLKSESTEQLNELASNLVPLVFADGTHSGGPCSSFANGVWIDLSLPVKATFKEVLDNAYKAVLKQVDFGSKSEEARCEVNSWVEKETRGLIKDLLPCGTVDETTRIILANALYFKGAWDQKFLESRTNMFDFHLLNGRSVKAPFMTSQKNQFVSAFDSLKVLKLPYKQGGDHNRRFSMYMYLPNATNGLSSLVERVCSEAGFFDRYLPRSKVEVGAFLIPKFKITFGFEACQVLEPLGLKLPSLSETVAGDQPAVSMILHKSFIEVNEEGTEAAAATAAVAIAWCLEKIDFVADHPFLFLIREEVTGAVMFIGHVLDPVAG